MGLLFRRNILLKAGDSAVVSLKQFKFSLIKLNSILYTKNTYKTALIFPMSTKLVQVGFYKVAVALQATDFCR